MQKCNSMIGWMMNVYRRSFLHNAFTGAILAKMLGLVVQFRKRFIEKEIGGVRFNLDLGEVIDSSLYYSGTFEPKIEAILANHIKPGMVVIDIGANIGYHTFRMARLAAPNGRVYAIEPTSTAFEKLNKNAELNPNIQNITFLNLGLAQSDIGEQEIAFRSSYPLSGNSELRNERVRLLSLDSLVVEQGIEKLDFIKLDVDGFEGKILTGAKTTLERYRPGLVVEITPSEMISNDGSPEAIIKMLHDLGYDFYTEDQEPFLNLQEHCAALHKGFSAMVVAIPKKLTAL